MVDLVTRLLVCQEISFIPTIQLKSSAYGAMIGELVFISYYAASNYDEKPFFVYESIPIPFNYVRKRVRLAQTPAYIGIHPDSRQFVRWSREEAAPCGFEMMTSCRITPAIQKDLEDTCIYQVLTDTPLTACRIELYPDLVFVRQIEHYWTISTNSSTKCHSANILDSDQYKVLDNHAITVPPPALIVTKHSTTLSCDLFYLPGLSIQSKLKLFYIKTPQLILLTKNSLIYTLSFTTILIGINYRTFHRISKPSLILSLTRLTLLRSSFGDNLKQIRHSHLIYIVHPIVFSLCHQLDKQLQRTHAN